MLGLFIVALVVCLLSAGTNTVLHFQMKLRLEPAGLQAQSLTKLGMIPQARQAVKAQADAAPDEWDEIDV
jgi:hypothetical protein